MSRKLGWASLLVSTVMAQSFSPEMEAWGRVKTHLRAELDHLPNYTCLETLTRFNRQAPRLGIRQELKPLDTVRLEIAFSGHQEWFGSPGDRKFTADTPVGFVGSGMIGNGEFGMTLHNVLEAGAIQYAGEETQDGRPAVRYDFRISGKTLEITILQGTGKVGEAGSFWVDPKSLDLIRLESHAIDIPDDLPLAETGTTVHYARTQIGGSSSLLPQQAEMHMLESNGNEGFDRIEFTHCRAFSVESVISFGADPRDTAVSAAPRKVNAIGPADPVPPFLPVTLLLTTPVTDRDAVGSLIEAKIAGDVIRKGKVVVPSGSVVRGRIRRLERAPALKSEDFAVGLEFIEVEVNGEPQRFYADFLRTDKNPLIRATLSETVFVRTMGVVQAKAQPVVLPELPGVAAFFIRGRTFELPRGFRMYWRTRGYIHGLD